VLTTICFTRSRFALLLAGGLSIGTTFESAPAFAAPPALGSKPLGQSLTGDARAAYDSAKLLFEDGDHTGALTKFKSAFELSKDPRLLWNMAVCEKELRHYARSAGLVSRYLSEGGKAISAEQRRNASDTQAALRAFYSEVDLSGAPDGATVLVDGVALGQIPLTEPLLVDLGAHKLRLELDGYAPFETSIDVPGSNRFEVPVVLSVAPIAEPAVAQPRLSVTSSGERDIIAVDGKVMGSHHWEGALSVGEHSVRVTAAHKKTYETHLQLTAGSSRSLQVALEDDAHGSTVWYWVAGGAAVAAGAVVGGYFLLKPKEEPGSHPSGSLTTIFLPSSGAAAAVGGGPR
jgi:hypothetical protein